MLQLDYQMAKRFKLYLFHKQVLCNSEGQHGILSCECNLIIKPTYVLYRSFKHRKQKTFYLRMINIVYL